MKWKTKIFTQSPTKTGDWVNIVYLSKSAKSPKRLGIFITFISLPLAD